MLKADMIPKEAVEAARKFMHLQALSDEWIDDLLAAALAAWPGMASAEEDYLGPACIILPIPQEGEETDWGKPQGKEEW